MKLAGILLALILIVWVFITQLGVGSNSFILKSGVFNDTNIIAVKRILWLLLIVLQFFFCVKVYQLIKVNPGNYTVLLKVGLLVSLAFLIICIIIFIISISAFWM